MAEGFGEKLKRLRAAAGLTQEGLARAANLSVSFVSKLEREGLDPSWTAVQAIAAALGVDCAEFSEQPAPKKKGGK